MRFPQLALRNIYIAVCNNNLCKKGHEFEREHREMNGGFGEGMGGGNGVIIL